ncbi:hypothetical protein PsAD2_03869 [Pseudovibrio axinellae]|uniref:Uncharacterized protein n=1 Tax=Pseudovibrio axinellae TaxID=989403 RepID=A0A165UMJ6_9HYPH|nr:hypothetical protein [Pseudovibrio axinellae]KZL12563.1 hypothetical protein PsAD2_03869 [Pseudovibrio axinellae]SEP66708.1 hypothetical protein SAMN05421798_101111 [Pseudovibrio axinellae]
MTLTPSQIKWLSLAQGGVEEFVANSGDEEKKTEKITDILAKLDADKEVIRKAQDFQIELARHPALLKLTHKNKKMPWMSGDMQSEVDSYADVKADTPLIPAKDVDALLAAFGKILERQAEMLSATKTDGKTRLFTDEDITRELWTPLIREGIIPSNIVPDKYSQFAQMFKGSSEIYEGKLEEHSETASKYENTLEAIGFARDVVSLAGSLGSNALTIANFDDQTHSRAEKREIAAKRQVLKGNQDKITSDLATQLQMKPGATDGEVLDKAAEVGGFEAQITHYQNIEDAQIKLVDKLVGQTKLFEEEKALLTMSTSLLDAGLATTEKGLKFSEREKNIKTTLIFAQDVADTVATQMKLVLEGASKTYEHEQHQITDQVEFAGTADKDTLQGLSYASGAMSLFIESNQVARKITLAVKAKTNKEKENAVLQIAGSMADSLAELFFTMGDVQGHVDTGKKDSKHTRADESKAYAYGSVGPGPGNEDDQTELIGVAIKAFFVASVNVGAAVKALKERNYLSFTESLMLGMVQAASSATTGPLAAMAKPEIELNTDAQRAQLDKLTPQELLDSKLERSGCNFTRTEREAFLDGFDDPSYLHTITNNIREMQDAFRETKKDPQVSEELTKRTNTAIQNLEAKKSWDALADFKRKQSNPAERDAFMKELEADVDAETKALKDLIKEASPPPNPEDAVALRKSLAAIDKLIADIKASEMKYKLIEKVAKGGVQVLVRVVPATGMVEACRKLAFDAIALGKKSAEVEKWRKNVKMAQTSNSPYYHAAKERHTQAAVQVSQKTINTFLSIIGVISETARIVDSTQAATGLSVAKNMAQALSDFGYKTYGRAKVVFGWRKYLDARKNPENRKKAREAIAWNSTLAKCVLAYGIVEERDPIAQQVGRNCGLTPEVLVSNSDVCSAVVRYFETLYSEDPVVLRRVPKVASWHPGTPDLTLKSWFSFKRAASQKAYPLMSKEDCKTPAIEQAMKALHTLCNGDPFNYPSIRDSLFSEETWQDKIVSYATEAKLHLEALEKEFAGYRPLTAEPTDPKTQVWKAGVLHAEMREVADSLHAQATLILREAKSDLKAYSS